MTTSKPQVKLIGQDGNAFAIIGACLNAARRAKWEKATIEQMSKEMMEGDYDHLLRTATKYFEVC